MKALLYKYGPAAGFFVLLAALWETATRTLQVPHYLVPRLSSVLVSIWETRALLLRHSLYTLQEALIGLVFSVIFGVLLAALIESFGLARRMLYPLLIASQTIPIVALSPIMVMWFGYEIWSKVAIVILFTFFPIAVGTVDGFRRTDEGTLELMKTMGASSRQIFRKLKIPSALPSFFTGLKVAATFSIGGATIGEWLGADSGLGTYTKRASSMLRAEAVFAGVLVLSLLGIMMFLLAKWLESRVFSWRRNPPE
ncbi:MAG: transporter permease [Paenibacillaceae bacterium]|jgi:putative hydroxymethylpyrimidine transport system permease protein|nr:transporter permease [Paenibacillaceae bacterium]